MSAILEERLQQERAQLRADLLERKVPKRVPITVKIQLEAACEFAGIDLRKALYNPELVEKACSVVCDHFYSDTFPMVNMRFPWSFQISGSQNWVVSSSGAVQHPEVENMKTEWYDEFIANPVDVMFEKIIPNCCKALDVEPVQRGALLAQACRVSADEWRILGEMTQRLTNTHGYMEPLAGPLVPIPFDNLADKFRGFKGIMMDMRRMPDKVAAAVKALLPLDKYLCKDIKPGTVCFLPLHMPPYISTKAFEELYWPTFEEMILFMHKRGAYTNVFAEGDWSRYYEHISKLPPTTSFQLEEGDWPRIKSTFGKEHVIGGLFDPMITLTRTKEACIDEAKKLFDTCGEGGKFYFCFNRNIMDIKSIDVPKLQAVLEWVRTKAVY